MTKLAAALEEAAQLAQTEDATAFGAGLSGVLGRVKKGVSEVRKSLQLLDDVKANPGAWTCLLRAAAEKPSMLKQVWETTALLLESDGWAKSFSSLEAKHRLSFSKAAARDGDVVAALVAQLVLVGAATLDELFPAEEFAAEGGGGPKPGVCVSILEALEQQPDLSPAERKSVLESKAAQLLQEKGAEDEKEKRKVIGPSGGKDAFGKGDAIPVFVCEGISGSHQKMEIKKGL
eukprot:TRINITY_DN93820_c0_g1_i1.p1 TRINITY_DN93820_c0_g1~~TRINITY_DN93820_c0_g1_i1.p1  ORF type:complete len:233 (-),score=83.66 TRINITY_DN93820_c0_g1_i1:29-727(-)